MKRQFTAFESWKPYPVSYCLLLWRSMHITRRHSFVAKRFNALETLAGTQEGLELKLETRRRL